MKKPVKFKPRRGQTDFTHIRWAPVINCVVMHRRKILLVQRSPDLHFYPGYWNGVSGFLDDDKSLNEKALEELKEELGLSKKDIVSIKQGAVFDQDEPKYEKTWIVHPVLVKVRTDRITTDREAKKAEWLTLKEARKLRLLPGFDRVLRHLFSAS
ncbi:MAG: NUDIX domain-containing protein [Patescibacteria group bacterium]|nr:NUDIX domain-containing protein [Patescibacteria group bacterium]